METIYLNSENLADWQQQAKPSVMALGFFDGLHMGHQQVIRTALQIAEDKNLDLSVMSFFPHPKTVLSNGKTKVDYLMPLSEKEKILGELGVDTFYIVAFDKEFSSLSPEQFAANYLINLGVVYAVAGFDYTYGFRGAGNMDRLQRDSGGLLDVTKVEKVEFRGEKISSTCIREKLLTGKVKELPDFLGRPYVVKCVRDGNFLNTCPYYTVPAPGKYEVTVKGMAETQIIELQVTDEKELIPITLLEGLTPDNDGLLSIIWQQKIEEDRVGSISVDAWSETSFNRFVRIG